MSEQTIEAPPRAGPARAGGAGARPRASARALVLGHPAISSGIGVLAFSTLLVLWARTRPGYDPYGWLVWGHQTLQWTLDTNGAPSWKPLTYLFTLPYGLFGHYAMWLWLITAVAFGLSGVLFAGRIAYRLTTAVTEKRHAAIAAGVFAGLGLLGIRDYMHYILSAQSDPMIVTLCLAAIDSHLSGRRRTAFVLGVLASLGRPEVWPFVGLYALWAARAIPSLRILLAAGLALIPLLWFGIPALTANSPFAPGNLATHSAHRLHHDLILGTIDRFFDLHEWPLQLAALVAIAVAVRRRDRTLLVLGAGVIVWVLVEVAFALHKWPGIPRYMFEAAGVTVVLAGVAVGWLLAHFPGSRLARLPRSPRVPAWAGVVVVALLVGSLVPAAVSRLRIEHKDLYRERHRTVLFNRLQAVVTRLGAAHIRACGQPVSQLEFQSVMAFTIGMNVGSVGYHPRSDVRLVHHPVVLFRPVGHGWRIYPIHTRASKRAACRNLRTSTPLS